MTHIFMYRAAIPAKNCRKIVQVYKYYFKINTNDTSYLLKSLVSAEEQGLEWSLNDMQYV